MRAHHAADVADYKSPDFDPCAALRGNTLNLRKGLAAAADASQMTPSHSASAGMICSPATIPPR